jgi:dihydroorotate dehydrogenase (fumarate)
MTIRRLLDVHSLLKDIQIIGIGGVSSRAGFERMIKAGATAVGVGTALGTHGVSIFEMISTNSAELQRPV